MAAGLLERDQWVPTPVEETFALYADAYSLEEITPPWLAFRVTTPRPLEISAGTYIDYRLRLHGVPVRWRSRITDWDPPHGFVDEQVRGPYRSWQHRHGFEPEEGGTRIIDEIRYELPLGAVGRLASPLVRRDLREIFDYRHEAVAGLLGADVAGAVPA